MSSTSWNWDSSIDTDPKLTFDKPSPMAEEPDGYHFYNDPHSSVMGQLILKRIAQGRDIKIIITSDGLTGTGKTTLAYILSKDWHYYDDWDASNYAFFNPKKWMNEYLRDQPGASLLLDEMEQAMDSRQWWDNVEETQMLAQARVRQKISVWTLPTMTMLEKRVPVLSDIWIRVVERGRGSAYYLRKYDNINSRSAKIQPTKFNWVHPELPIATQEFIRWGSMDHDPNFKKLEAMKERNLDPEQEGEAYYDTDDVGEMVTEAKQSTIKEIALKAIELKENEDMKFDFTQKELADALKRSQSWVSQLKDGYYE